MKIDVEGHELAVLKGASALLGRDKPVILFEQHKENFRDGKSPVCEYLKSAGYKKFAAVKATPNVSAAWPKAIRNMMVVILRLTFGLRYEVQLLDQIEVDAYPFVIALPD